MKLLTLWAFKKIYIYTYVVTCFLPSTIRILALLYVLSTVLRISSSNLLYIYLGGRLADHSDFVWAFHFQSQGKALWGRGWMMMMMMMMIVKIW